MGSMKRTLVIGLLLAALGCGGGEGVTGPSSIPAPQPLTFHAAPLPSYWEGFYIYNDDILRGVPGTVHILWSRDEGRDMVPVAKALRARGQVVFLEGGFFAGVQTFQRGRWDKFIGHAQALSDHGVLAGVYVVDESSSHGILDSEVARATEFVHSLGLPSMGTRSWGHRKEGRLPVDYYSVVAYDAYGAKKEWTRDYHRTADTDWIVGQAFDDDLEGNGGWERGMPDQTYWRQTARETGKPIINFIWSNVGLPGYLTCEESPECRAVWSNSSW